MKKSRTTEQLKCEYEKVYEAPLNWCPLFGYLPEIEESHFYNNKQAYKIATECHDIINSCREAFIDYCPAWHMVKYVCVPELKIMFPEIDSDTKKEFETWRCLFKYLDYVALKAEYCMYTAIPYTIIGNHYLHDLMAAGDDLKAIPDKPIGRVSNLYDNFYSVIALDVRVNEIVRDCLLSEAQKIIDETVKVDDLKLFSLYAILEAWLILTSLHHNKKHNAEYLLHCRERLTYANILLNIADSYSKLEEKNELYLKQIGLESEIDDIERKTQKSKQSSRKGGLNKSKTIQTAIKEIIARKLPRANYITIFEYIKKNHKGKTKAIKCDTRSAFWIKDKNGDHPEGFIIEYDMKEKREIKRNNIKSFERNFQKAKSKNQN